MEKLTIKRLNNELKKLANEPLEYIDTYVDPDNLFTFYFLVRGPHDSDYSGGYYIGKIMVSPGYPKTPVDFMMLTPNGRFEANSKICLTNSGYHADQWTPMWDMTAMLHAFLSIMLADDTSGISHIRRTPEERKLLAQQSFNYNIANNSEIFAKFSRFIQVEDGHFKPKLFSVPQNTVPEKKDEVCHDIDNKKEPMLAAEKHNEEIKEKEEKEENNELTHKKKKPAAKKQIEKSDSEEEEKKTISKKKVLVESDKELDEKKPVKKIVRKKKPAASDQENDEEKPVKKIVRKNKPAVSDQEDNNEKNPIKKVVRKKKLISSDQEKDGEEKSTKKVISKKLAVRKL